MRSEPTKTIQETFLEKIQQFFQTFRNHQINLFYIVFRYIVSVGIFPPVTKYSRTETECRLSVLLYLGSQSRKIPWVKGVSNQIHF